MAIQTTLADLRLRCKQRFDAGSSTYIDDAQYNQLINEAGAHLHNWIITTAEWYIWQTFAITLVANQIDYALTVDFFKDLKVFAVSPASSGPSAYYPVPRMMPQEFRGGTNMYNRGGLGSSFAYMILGQTLRLSSAPAVTNPASTSIEMWYAPHYTPLLSDIDVMSVAVAPGWDEFVVNQVVINARLKEESDIKDLLIEQERIKTMIQEDIVNRDLGRPQHVVDATQGSWPYGPWGLNGWY